MSQNTYEDCLDDMLDETIDDRKKYMKSCIDYLKMFQIYHKRIKEAKTIKEAKEWADRMLDHAIQVTEE